MIHKKRKKNASFGFYSHTQGRFRPFPACFGRIGSIGRRPIRPDMADMARFWPNQPDSARIEADSARIEPHRRESSRVGANPRKKKKTQTRSDARATASDAGAAPLVPRPCFLDHYHHCYLRRIKERKFKFNCFIQCLWTHFKKSRFLFQHLKIGEEFSPSRGE